MTLGIGQRQGRAPGATEYEPAIDAKVRAQLLHVVDQVRCGVVLDLAQGMGPAAAALVEDHDPVEGGVEEPAVSGIGAGARPAMQEYDRDALWVAALLVIHPMRRGKGEEARVKGLDFGEQVLGGHCALTSDL